MQKATAVGSKKNEGEVGQSEEIWQSLFNLNHKTENISRKRKNLENC
jgi:hypothetical protein